jgi:hypothetical protein
MTSRSASWICQVVTRRQEATNGLNISAGIFRCIAVWFAALF